jgi:hypothetical protein
MQGVVPNDNSPGWKQIDEPLLYNVLRLVDIDGLALIRHGENRTSLEVVAMLIYTARRDKWQQPAIPSTVHGQYGRETDMFMHYELVRSPVARLVGSKSSCSYVRACATSALRGH